MHVDTPVQDPPKPKIQRTTPPEKQDPSVKYQDAKSAGQQKAEWGAGDDGYLPPSNPSDKMRKNMPYKVMHIRPYAADTLRLNSRECSTSLSVTGMISNVLGGILDPFFWLKSWCDSDYAGNVPATIGEIDFLSKGNR